MPRSRGDKEYRIPTQGLNTEASALDFPIEAAVDINNMEVGFDPLRIKPRLGHTDNELTANGTTVDPVGAGLSAITWHKWEKASGDNDSNFLLIQNGRKLVFVDADSTDVTTSLFGLYLDLDDVASGTTKGTTALAKIAPLQYTEVKGHVLITSEAIDPTIIRYDVDAGTLSFDQLTLKCRDLIGLESEIDVDDRPSSLGDFPVGIAGSGTYPSITQQHEYNLYNQGWYQQRRLTSGSKTVSDPIAEFNTQNGEYPSNADIVYIGMVDDGGDLIFDAELLKDQTFGSTPSARGHYVLDVFNLDRENARNNPLESGASTGGGSTGGGTGGRDFTGRGGTV